MRDFLTRFCIPFSIPGVTLFSICWLYPHNVTLAVIVSVIFAGALAYRPSRFKLSMALYAILLGTWGEYMCCKYGLWVYKYPFAYRLPLWIPFIWPILLTSMWEISTYIMDLLEKRSKALRVALLVGLVVIILTYVAFTSYYLRNNVAWILLGFFAFVVIFSRKPINVWLFVAVSAGGFFGEFVCVQYDVWYYTRPVFKSIGMPLSLPMAWGVSGNVVWVLATFLPVFGRNKREPQQLVEQPT